MFRDVDSGFIGFVVEKYAPRRETLGVMERGGEGDRRSRQDDLSILSSCPEQGVFSIYM